MHVVYWHGLGVLRRVYTVYWGYLLGIYPIEEVRCGLNIIPNTPIRLGTNSIPVPDTWIASVRSQYQYPHFDKFGTASIPAPDDSVRVYRGYLPYRTRGYLPYRSGSVGPQYQTEHSGKVRYELDTGTRHFGKFGTTSMPVPNTQR